MTAPLVMPSRMILDFEDIYWGLRADISRNTQMTVDWDAFFSQLFEQLMALPCYNFAGEVWGEDELRALVNQMAYGDLVFENNVLTPDQRSRVYTAILKAALLIKERLLILGAYHRGRFPYLFTTMINDGCLLFSKNDRCYEEFNGYDYP